MLDTNLIKNLLEMGETSTVEFKIAPPRPAELAERLCGFANGQGGYIVLGVADNTWEPVGVKNPPAAIDCLLQAARSCKPAIRFDPPDPQIIEINGNRLVIASVPPNNGVLFQANRVFWIRRGTHTVPLESDELENFFHNRGTLGWENAVVPDASLNDLDFELIREFLKHRSGRFRESPTKANLESLLVRSRCAMIQEEKGRQVLRPTNAGLLLFGKEPQEFLPHAQVVCVQYGDEIGLRRYLDRRTLSGNLAQLVDKSADYLRLNIKTAGIIHEFSRQDVPAYSLEVLREAVVNAIVHRDYSLVGENVRILIYPDRIEVHNPGLLMPGVDLDALKRGEQLSRPRNPVLVDILASLPGNYMEKLGSGINFMITESYRLGKPEPVFKLQGEFVVIFRQEQSPAQNLPQLSTLTSQSNIPLPSLRVSDEQERVDMTQRQRQELALHYIRENGSITNKEYRTITGASDNTALRDLEMLLERGSIRASGKRRGRKYFL
jgi:ATP-dependent DNA helicase RecG